MAENDLVFADPAQLPFQANFPALNSSIPTQNLAENDAGLQAGLMQQRRQDLMQRNLANLDEQQGGFLPTALAVGALLQGNVGPLLAQQEQKRRTAFAKAVQPFSAQLSNLTNQGKWEEAADLSAQLASEMGARVPELGQFFAEQNKLISKKQQQFAEQQALVDTLGPSINQEGVPDDVKLAFNALKANLKHKTPMSEAGLGFVMNNLLKKHTQIINGQVHQVGEVTGQVNSQVLPSIMSESELNNAAGHTIANAVGLSIPELTQVLNKKTVTTGKGDVIEAGSPRAQSIYNMWVGTGQGLRANEQANIQPDPGVTTAQLEQGYNPAAIRLGLSLQGMSPAIARDQARKVEVAVAPDVYRARFNPWVPLEHNQKVIDLDASPSRFGSVVPDPMALADVQRAGGRVGFIDGDLLKQKVMPAMDAVNGLSYIDDFTKLSGEPKGWYERSSTGINKWVSDKIGIAVGKNIEIGKAAELFMDRAIENVGKTEMINNEVVKELKEFIKGKMSDPVEAKRTAEYVQRRLLEQVQLYTGRHIDMPGGQRIPSAQPTSQGVQQAPQGGFQPASPYSTYTPGKTGRKSVQAQAQQILNPPGMEAQPGAVPQATPTQPATGIKKGTLR